MVDRFINWLYTLQIQFKKFLKRKQEEIDNHWKPEVYETETTIVVCFPRRERILQKPDLYGYVTWYSCPLFWEQEEWNDYSSDEWILFDAVWGYSGKLISGCFRRDKVNVNSETEKVNSSRCCE